MLSQNVEGTRALRLSVSQLQACADYRRTGKEGRIRDVLMRAPKETTPDQQFGIDLEEVVQNHKEYGNPMVGYVCRGHAFAPEHIGWLRNRIRELAGIVAWQIPKEVLVLVDGLMVKVTMRCDCLSPNRVVDLKATGKPLNYWAQDAPYGLQHRFYRWAYAVEYFAYVVAQFQRRGGVEMLTGEFQVLEMPYESSDQLEKACLQHVWQGVEVARELGLINYMRYDALEN